MICQGGIVADRPRPSPLGRGGSERYARSQNHVESKPNSPLDELWTRRSGTSWRTIVITTTVLGTILWFLPRRDEIAPLVESDYCYLLLAADRLYDGMGPTSLQPIAPQQPWEWRYDWGFLTQWPTGYPLLVAAVRSLTGATTIGAVKGISVVATSLALVAWFTWVRRFMPKGVTSIFLAAVAAAGALPLGLLLNPSTDAILIALLPVILLLVTSATVDLDGFLTGAASKKLRSRTLTTKTSFYAGQRLALAGTLAGILCWFRYAAIFVPAGITLFLLVRCLMVRRVWTIGSHGPCQSRDSEGAVPTSRTNKSDRADTPHSLVPSVVIFAISATAPIAALAAVNGMFGPASSAAERFNLGSGASWHGSWSLLSTTWWNLTDLGFFSHRPFVHGALALGPILLGIFAVAHGSTRRAFAQLLSVPAVGLSLCTLTALLALLVLATALFGDKFNYVSLDRYYLPGRPLFVALALAPLMLISRRIVRAALAVGLIACASWIVQVDWIRGYQKATTRQADVTPYGQWSRCFTPDANGLYAWLRSQASPDLVVVSNYHETLALETGLPTLPVPSSRQQLDEWLEHLTAARGVTHPRVLFVLDADNRWRSYWIPDVPEIRRTFELANPLRVPNVGADLVYTYPQGRA